MPYDLSVKHSCFGFEAAVDVVSQGPRKWRTLSRQFVAKPLTHTSASGCWLAAGRTEPACRTTPQPQGHRQLHAAPATLLRSGRMQRRRRPFAFATFAPSVRAWVYHRTRPTQQDQLRRHCVLPAALDETLAALSTLDLRRANLVGRSTPPALATWRVCGGFDAWVGQPWHHGQWCLRRPGLQCQPSASEIDARFGVNSEDHSPRHSPRRSPRCSLRRSPSYSPRRDNKLIRAAVTVRDSDSESQILGTERISRAVSRRCLEAIPKTLTPLLTNGRCRGQTILT